MNRNAGQSEGPGTSARSRAEAEARRRAAVEIFARHEETLRRTARRYSLCADDVDDALQRALEIVLTKAPTDDPRELIRWTQTVTKHEALAVRQSRERILAPQSPQREGGGEDWVATIPANSVGPAERVERREEIARSREALRALKPDELRALTLLAEGYSYLEIERITGFSQTKINRSLAEGRDRFRKAVVKSEDGGRCAELRPLLSPFCDGRVAGAEAEALREHLRACAGCRASLRAYRAAPHTAAALAPALPVSRSLLDRAHDAFAGLVSRLPGQGGDPTLSQVAASGGTRGAGVTALAKLLTICAGTVGGAACVAAGVVPVPLDLGQRQAEAPRAAQPHRPRAAVRPLSAPEYEPAPEPAPAPKAPQPAQPEEAISQPATAEAAAPAETSAGAVEYAPEPAPVASTPPSAETGAPATGSAAGEFGP